MSGQFGGRAAAPDFGGGTGPGVVVGRMVLRQAQRLQTIHHCFGMGHRS
jgi:hypothetical protein